MKLSHNDHYGPYAMLVREIAFYSDKVSNHNHLMIPESVEI